MIAVVPVLLEVTDVRGEASPLIVDIAHVLVDIVDDVGNQLDQSNV
jgi:hypothetical protein